jgi:hypothetical protein
VAAGHLHQVGVPHHRPEALIVRVLKQAIVDGAVPRNRPLGAQFGKNVFALCGRRRPELQ